MRFPIFALIAPLVTSIVLWVVTGSAYTLLFALLGPMMAVGHYVDGRIHARKERARQEALDEDEDQARSQQEHLDFCTQREQMLLRYPPSSFYSEQHEVLRPAWAAGAVPEGAQRIIRLGTSRVNGMPVLLDVTLGIALRGDFVEMRSVMRALAFQLAWVWGSPEITRVGLDFAEEPELVSLLSARIKHPLAVTAQQPVEALPLGVRYLLKIDRGHATLVDTVDPTITPQEMSVDLLSRAEVGHILPRLLAETPGAEEELHVLPDRVPAVLNLEEEWESARETLLVNVGRQHGHPLLLDLVAAGPHAIVTGMTGSGKTEFLRTWLVAMAATYSPQELSVVVIDFKGGAGFSSLKSLPHIVGMVTDLDHPEALRAITSLQAEIRFREEALAGEAVADIASLDMQLLPRLIVVVDEYRAVLEAFPELVNIFVDLAARGRALGIHVILSSQRIGGALGDSLLANCALRVGFRVAQKQDSQALLGNEESFLLPHIPGRGVLAGTGTDQREFQAAHLTPLDIDLVERRCAQWVGHHSAWKPRIPWLPPLPAEIGCEAMPTSLPGVAWLGLADLPEHQVQSWVHYSAPVDGNLLVTGPARSGRSSAVELIARQCGVEVITEAEAAWDVIVENGRKATPSTLVIDDLDALLEEFDHEHREEFIAALIRISRSAPKEGSSVILSCSEHVRGVTGLISLFPSVLSLRDSHKPGRATWRDHEVQLVKMVPNQPSASNSEDFTFGSDGTYVVITHRKAERQEGLRKQAHRVVDLASDLSVVTGGEAALYLGTPDEWMAQPRLLSSLRHESVLVLDGCSSAELRGLRLRSGLFPHVGYGKTLVIEPDGSTTRVIL